MDKPSNGCKVSHRPRQAYGYGLGCVTPAHRDSLRVAFPTSVASNYFPRACPNGSAERKSSWITPTQSVPTVADGAAKRQGSHVHAQP